ncbi:pentapeptide repeat-containing protein [Nonomuraea sp. NPDC050540]|uniref:pentapeptide repeat-containing protein n=1 Tax=Nonomuraea sp. NPDC050540 TaxID=3364367 RepID=UPI00379ACA5A
MAIRSPRVPPRAAIAAAAAARARRGFRDMAPPPALREPSAPEPSPALEPTSAAPSRRWSRLRLAGLILSVMVIAGCAGMAAVVPEPGWLRWLLAGIALAGAAGWVLAFLVGPAAWRLAGESAPLSAAERAQMTVAERVEAVNAARHTLIQAATGLVVIGGVAFTALGLWYTARTVETAQQGQITDRYTKAFEQLGSDKIEVRLGGIHALRFLSVDSPRDREIVIDVLSAFVRSRDTCALPSGQKTKSLPKQCTTTDPDVLADLPYVRPGADVRAAMNIASAIASERVGNVVVIPDLSEVRFPRTDLRGLPLIGLNMAGADLRGADLTGADLTGTFLTDADLTGALGVNR